MLRKSIRNYLYLIVVTVFICLITGGCAVKVFDEDKAQAEVDSILYSVAALRELEVLAPVPVRLMDQRDVESIIAGELESEYSEEDLANEAKLYYHLGLIPRGYDIKAGLIEFYTDQAAAFYDSKKDEMILITPIRSFEYATFFMIPGYRRSAKRLILSHELVHALDDQHFHLEEYSCMTRDNQDHLLAMQAVFEGSAMLFSVLYLFENFYNVHPYNMEKIIENINQGTQKELARTRIPEAIVAPIYFAYCEGFRFVHAVFKERGIEGVNELFEDEYLSTENILHPERYLAELDLPVEVEPWDLGERFEGYEKLCEDTMGEFGVDLILRHYLPEDVAGKAAEGWSGDRYTLREKDGMLLFLWNTAWETKADADEFHRALIEVLQMKYPGLNKNIEDAEFEYFEREKDDVLVIIFFSGEKVALLENPPRVN